MYGRQCNVEIVLNYNDEEENKLEKLSLDFYFRLKENIEQKSHEYTYEIKSRFETINKWYEFYKSNKSA